MHVVALDAIGAFPTGISDLGEWCAHLSNEAHRVSRFDVNHALWRTIFSPEVNEGALELTAAIAERSLVDLTRLETYDSAMAYVEAFRGVADHLVLLDRAEGDVIFTSPPRVRGLDYSDSRGLAAYAQRDTLLTSLLEDALARFPQDAALVAMRVTSGEDLLLAMIAARLIRRASPDIHVCLADHGYENFSLHLHLDALKASGALNPFFDTVVLAKEDRDVVLPALVQALAAGEEPRGFVTRGTLPWRPVEGAIVAPAALSVFAPEPVLSTRVSSRRCYWSRCTFCTQNAKYAGPKPPSQAEIPAAIDRLETYAKAGYRTFIFGDEALSPAMLRSFSEAVLARKLDVRWGCRCKLELQHTPALFELMKRAGCYEVLFGLESISPRTQRRMDKYVEGLDAVRVRQILLSLSDAGIGLHLNMIGAFPGETVAELEETVGFAGDLLSECDGATWLLNTFEVFPDTPVEAAPQKFGLRLLPREGDIEAVRSFAPVREIADDLLRSRERIPALRRQLFERLGWAPLHASEAGARAMRHYFTSPHGAIFKQRPSNPFSNPLRRRLHVATA